MRKDRRLTAFGIEVKKKLIEYGKTQKQLAYEVGTSDVYLNLILHGERSGKKYLNKIADALDIDLLELGKSAWTYIDDSEKCITKYLFKNYT